MFDLPPAARFYCLTLTCFLHLCDLQGVSCYTPVPTVDSTPTYSVATPVVARTATPHFAPTVSTAVTEATPDRSDEESMDGSMDNSMISSDGSSSNGSPGERAEFVVEMTRDLHHVCWTFSFACMLARP